MFASKGQSIRDKDAEPATTPDGELELPAADRVVLVRYLEFPMLLRLSKQTHGTRRCTWWPDLDSRYAATR